MSRSSLFACEDPAQWRRVYDQYWDVVEARSAVKGKKFGKLLPLEKWFQEQLPELISSRSERYVTHPELLKLMEWKLTRGTFRPRLQQLLASNAAAAVELCSRTAFSLLPDVHAAIAELSTLKAVGPATASAVLAAGGPEHAAFMSDEAVGSVPGLTPIQYTARHYRRYLEGLLQRTARLNHADPQRDWTPHRAERCLWAWAVAERLQLPLLEELGGGGEGGGSPEADERPTKKRRTV